MASTYTDLGIELMATGENAGQWGGEFTFDIESIIVPTGQTLAAD